MKRITQSTLILTTLFLLSIQFSSGQTINMLHNNQMRTRWQPSMVGGTLKSEYPRPQLRRPKWKNLNGLWEYCISDSNTTSFVEAEGEILVPFPVESTLSRVKRTLGPNQLLWYRRNFHLTPEKRTRTILHFGAVDWEATVYINGKRVGTHQGGYTAFYFDVTDHLKYGSNEIVVKVFDPTNSGIGPHGKQTLNPANIYYTPSSGIWQTVWLETVPSVYIDDLKITPDIDKSVVNVVVQSATNNEVQLTVAGRKFTGQSNTNITVPIKNVRLWSPDDPFLYSLTAVMGKDRIKSYFGMRKISLGKDEKGFIRICLNNRYTYNLGTLDQGFWPDGLYAAPNDEALKFDIKAIKAMGFNTIRKHIKVEPARWYYYADKLGLMVWQDLVNPNQGLPNGAKEQFEKEGSEIISQLYNYPSITTWVLFNEKWGQYDQERLTNWLKAMDPSRLVNGHSGEELYVNGQLRSPSPNAYIGAHMTDVHSYPEPMMPVTQSGKAWVCGEFGGIGVSVPGHQWDDLTGWGYVQVSSSELDAKYDSMVKKLIELEKRGLSASIYTQPFDVEGEENGLLTYDREVIKIPFQRLREINGQLISGSEKPAKDAFVTVKVLDSEDNDSKYPAFQDNFERGKRDSSFLRRLILIALRKQDFEGVTKYGNAYISQLNSLFTKENLTFLNAITQSSRDAGFKIYLSESEKVNQVMGPNTSEKKVRTIVGKEEIAPLLKDKKNINWLELEKSMRSKYGPIGEEKFNGVRMMTALEDKDWANFGKYYSLYYVKAMSRSEYHINNISWELFEHVSDTDALKIGAKVTRYNVEKFGSNDPHSIDTYANILYKLGNTDEAVLWEEKAVRLSNNAKDFVDTLEKMKKGLPTWRVLE